MPKSFKLRHIKIKKKSVRNRKIQHSKSRRSKSLKSSVRGVGEVFTTLKDAYNKVTRNNILGALSRLMIQYKKLSYLLFLTKSLLTKERTEIKYQETLFDGLLRMKKCLSFHFIILSLTLKLHNKVTLFLKTLSKSSGRKGQRGGTKFTKLITSIVILSFFIQTLISAQNQQSMELQTRMEKKRDLPFDFNGLANNEVVIRDGQTFRYMKPELIVDPMEYCSVLNKSTSEECMHTITQGFSLYAQYAPTEGETLSARIKEEPPSKLGYFGFGTTEEDLVDTVNEYASIFNENMKLECRSIIELESSKLPRTLIFTHEQLSNYMKQKIESRNKKIENEYVTSLKQKSDANKKNKKLLEQGIEYSKNIASVSSSIQTIPVLNPVKAFVSPSAGIPVDLDEEFEYEDEDGEEIISINESQLNELNDKKNKALTQEEVDSLMLEMANEGYCLEDSCNFSNELNNIVKETKSKFYDEYRNREVEGNRLAYLKKICATTFKDPVKATLVKSGTNTSMLVQLPTNWYMIRIVIANMMYHIKRDNPNLIERSYLDLNPTNTTEIRLKSMYDMSYVFLKIIEDFEETIKSTFDQPPKTKDKLKQTIITVFNEGTRLLKEIQGDPLQLSMKKHQEIQSMLSRQNVELENKRANELESWMNYFNHYINLGATPLSSSTIAFQRGMEGFGDTVNVIFMNTLGVTLNYADIFGQDLVRVVLTYLMIPVLLVLVTVGSMRAIRKEITGGPFSGFFTRRRKKSPQNQSLSQAQSQLGNQSQQVSQSQLQLENQSQPLSQAQTQPFLAIEGIPQIGNLQPPIPNMAIDYYKDGYGMDYFKTHVMPVMNPSQWKLPMGYKWSRVNVDREGNIINPSIGYHGWAWIIKPTRFDVHP